VVSSAIAGAAADIALQTRTAVAIAFPGRM
jgi:hypothetical protein